MTPSAATIERATTGARYGLGPAGHDRLIRAARARRRRRAATLVAVRAHLLAAPVRSR